MEPLAITSLQNPRVKNLVKLREGKHRRRQRLFLIEGRREIQRAIEAGIGVETLYVSSDTSGEQRPLLDAAKAAGAELATLAPHVFAKVAFRENPGGLLAVARVPDASLAGLRLSPVPLLLVVEHVEKPGNLGNLVRTADAAGADAVVVIDPATDIFNPHAVRSSQGALFNIPVAQSTNEELYAFLADKGIAPYATTPDATKHHFDCPLAKPSALIMGSEAHGLGPYWLESGRAKKIAVPMRGGSDSLNVVNAAAVVLFEAVRQRMAHGPGKL